METTVFGPVSETPKPDYNVQYINTEPFADQIRCNRLTYAGTFQSKDLNFLFVM